MQTVEAETRTSPSPPSGPRGWIRWSLLALVGVLVLLAVGLLAFRLLRPGVLPGTTVGDLEVGGLTRAEVATAVAELADDRAAAAITVGIDAESVEGTAAEVGYRLDVDQTVEDVWRRGRQSNPLFALGDHVRSLYDETVVEPTVTIRDDELASWVSTAADTLDLQPVEGQVSFDGTTVVTAEPRVGYDVDREALSRLVRAAVLAPGDDELEAPAEVLRPVSTSEDVAAFAERAELAVSGPIELRRNGATKRFEPEELAQLLHITTDFSDGRASYELTADPEEVAAAFTSEEIEAFEAEVRDATFRLTSDGMEIVPSLDGYVFDADAVAQQLVSESGVDGGDDGLRTEPIAGDVTEPGRTTQEAEALQIVEPVASFTTEHACCQGRVTNIQRFADIMRGTVVEPGETVSLNGVVGERTRAKGFTDGGAILRGEYIEDVGGGVSQFATTFFNAAYFGGYEIVEHKPHSYYISRYPVGRESTIDYPTVDVKVRNDSPYGMYVHTSYTSTSITVTLWGTEWADVSTSASNRSRIRDPETEVEINPDLPEGTERVVQAGKQGFDITNTRTITYLDSGETSTEQFFTRYLPEPRIVERNPAGDG